MFVIWQLVSSSGTGHRGALFKNMNAYRNYIPWGRISVNNCKQPEVKHAPIYQHIPQKMYKPTYVPLYTGFHINTLGTPFIYTKFMKSLFH